MRFNKKTSYFISAVEFKEINKNPFVAGILSIILGMFGIHRFYLRRKLTGVIFCVIFIYSLEFDRTYLAAILMVISIIEGIVYIVRGVVLLKEKYANEKIQKNKYVGELKSPVNEEKGNVHIKEKITKTSKKEEMGELKIIEVSNVEPSKIPKENEFDSVLKTNWIKRLDLPYERNIMKVSQVKEETINLYKHLCNFIDRELKDNKNSLNRESKRIEIEDGRYNNILYTIYCISEGHVTKAYSGNYDYYNPELSYSILEDHLGKNLKDKVFNEAEKLAECVSSPNGETMKYFNLTKTGLPIEWWDTDGRFRINREFNGKELNILRATPRRGTKVWEIYEVKKQIIVLYLDIWKVILNGLKEKLKWEKKIKITLKGIIDGKYICFEDYENGGVLASLIKISENTIREVMPNTQILNISKEKDNIKGYLPSELVKDINDRIIEYKENVTEEEIKEILTGMIENDPDDWKLKVEKVLMAENNKRTDILIDYRENENFINMAKKIIKDTEDENLLLICLYGIGREENLSQRNARLLKNIIHPSNISVYKNILQSGEVLSLDLSNRLMELKNPIRKKIELDMDKVEESKEELNETVEILKEYIGDEEDNEELEEEDFKEKNLKEEYNDKLEFKYEDFLKLILNMGSIGVEKGKKIAMDNGTFLNAFISDVNRELYEHIQDQAIVIEDDFIKIDDFYVDTIKELMDNEK